MVDVNIWEAFLAGLGSVFVWPTFGYMLAGIGIGFAVGILPGLGGPVALALMLPFTFDMEPVEAFAFLLGMLAVTATTGDITSILFGVPGEVVSAALVVDGHPMAKQGQAGRALGAALMSSLIGALIGAFALAAAVPLLRPIVLSFGSPEFFMLAVLGICFLASLSRGAMLKGLIAGGLGLMLSMVGLDPQSATERYTFGQLNLWDGVGLVPVTLGLLAIPEIVDLATRGSSIAPVGRASIGGVMQGVRDSFRHGWLVVRCSLIGTFIGLIPALGGSLSQWLAYAHAVQSSRNKERFGSGAIEGVLGPGAANNSTVGGSLVPTIAFGVPGSVTMAVLLGAFLIQGLVPGPAMLTSQLPLTMSFVWIVVVSNILTVGVCLLFIKQIARITAVRGSLLIPSIILLVYVGAFAEKNALLDLGIVLVSGALALVMVHLGWPRPPLVLGLVLGRLAESYLFLSVARYDWDWLTHPIVLVLIVLSAVALLLPGVQPLIARVVARRSHLATRKLEVFSSDEP